MQNRSTRPQLSSEQLAKGIKRLSLRIEDVTAFEPEKLMSYEEASDRSKALETSIESSLSETFGYGTPGFVRFRSASHFSWPQFVGRRIDVPTIRESLVRCRTNSLAVLNAARSFLQEERELLAGETASAPAPSAGARSNPVFVVHGRDQTARLETSNLLSKLGLQHIILHEQPNAGRHLLTKFREEAKRASFAVVLMTPDDVGGLRGEPQCGRARQNVILELGYFLGLLGPDRVACLLKGDIEKPSDFDGIAYITMDDFGGWKPQLARELKQAGVPFDPQKLLEI